MPPEDRQDRATEFRPIPSEHRPHRVPRPRIADTLSALRMVRGDYRKPTTEPEGDPHDDA